MNGRKFTRICGFVVLLAVAMLPGASLIPSFIEIRESEAGGIRMKRIGAAY
jgi:hypothetical protein